MVHHYYCARLFPECIVIVSKGKRFYIFGTFFILLLSQLMTFKGYYSIYILAKTKIIKYDSTYVCIIRSAYLCNIMLSTLSLILFR